VGCELDSTDSVCDATAMDEIHVNFRATVTVTDENGQPVNDASVAIDFSKTPCDDIPKGFFNFDRITINGYTESGLVGYNFQNTEDYVEVTLSVQTSQGYAEDTQSIFASQLGSFAGQTRLINFTFDQFPL
jgi:hypothetical protein